MPNENDLPELIVGSKTQSSETIQKLLSEDYEGITVQTQSDAPPPADDKAAVEADGDKAGDETSASSEEAGSDAGEEEDETAGVEDAGKTATDAADKQDDKKKQSGAAKNKAQKLRMAARIEELERKLADFSTGDRVKEPEPDVVIPEATPEPDPDEFDNGVYDPGYIKAVSKWQLAETRREDLVQAKSERDSKAAESVQAQADTAAKAAKERWAEQVEIGKSKHDDFETVLAESQKMEAAVPLTEAIQESEFSGLLVYHLATHPEELKRLNKLLELPKNAPAEEFRKKMRIAHRELDRLEAAVSQDAGDSAADDADTTDAATGSARQTTEPARESRPAATSTPARAITPPKAKPEPVKPVGSRGGAIRPRRIQEMTSAEIHSMQERDPDGFRKLMEASRAS